jgi:hypothetical protein
MTMATLIRMALVITLGLGLGLPGAEAQTAPGTLIVQVSTEPPGLDLTTNPASAIAGVVFDNVQEGLIKIDRAGKMVPWLAERWYTTDSKNYTFFLRKEREIPQRARDEGGGREVRAGPGGESRDQAPLPHAVRGHPGRDREGRLHDHGGAQAGGRHVPLHAGPAGIGDLPARSGGHPQDPAAGHGAPSRCRSGCGRTASSSPRTRTTG